MNKKPRIIKAYDKLSTEMAEQLKIVYPLGFRKHLITYTDREGEKKKGLPFETEEAYYLIRMTEEKARNIIRDDDDYNDAGVLKSGSKAKYEDKYDDLDFLDDYNSNDDNDMGYAGDSDDNIDGDINVEDLADEDQD